MEYLTQINKSKIEKFLNYSKAIASQLNCSLLFFSFSELENKYLQDMFLIKEDFALIVSNKVQGCFNNELNRGNFRNKHNSDIFWDNKFKSQRMRINISDFDGHAFNTNTVSGQAFSTTLFLPFTPQKIPYCQKDSKCLIDSIKELRGLDNHLKGLKGLFGLEFNRLKASKYLQIKENCSLTGTSILDISAHFDGFFSLKDEILIAKISKSALLSDLVFKRLYLAIKASKIDSEHGAYEFIKCTVKKLGLEHAFSPIVANALNSANIHHSFSSKTPFKKGFILVDLGVKYEGLCSDMTRMMYLGKPSLKETELFNLVKSVQEKSIEFVSEGLFYHHLDNYAREQFGSYSTYFTHLLGHGLGYNVHEAPSFSKTSVDIVRKNQAFTIEPGIYLKGKFGIRIEDSCYFDGIKAVPLTKTKRNLFLV